MTKDTSRVGAGQNARTDAGRGQKKVMDFLIAQLAQTLPVDPVSLRSVLLVCCRQAATNEGLPVSRQAACKADFIHKQMGRRSHGRR